MNINLVLLGQSNARNLGTDGFMQSIADSLAANIGFDGKRDTVSVVPPASTTFAGTSLVPGVPGVASWLTGSSGAWADGPIAASADAAVAAAASTEDPSLIVWMFNESDSSNPDLTAGTWADAARHQISAVRAALGDPSASSPVLFVPVPYDDAPGFGLDVTAQEIKDGMASLVSDPSFDAMQGPQAGDENMNRDSLSGFSTVYGGLHGTYSDEAQLAGRIAGYVTREFVPEARPGSPAATSMGSLDLTGPFAWAATTVPGNPDQVAVFFALSAGQSLSTAHVVTDGWSIHVGGVPVPILSARVEGGSSLILAAASAIPAGAVVRYGYGEGRIAPLAVYHADTGAYGSPGQGDGLYDMSGRVASVPLDGLVVDGPVSLPAIPAETPSPGTVVYDSADGTSGTVASQAYPGPADYLESQFAWRGLQGVVAISTTPNAFLVGGPGDDALEATGGSNVLDGGTGSNFLVGTKGQGQDTFFADARPDVLTWDTIVNFHPGDALTAWGIGGPGSSYGWAASPMGAVGYQGATLVANGHGHGFDTLVTFAGMSVAQAAGLVTNLSPGSSGGLPYLYVGER